MPRLLKWRHQRERASRCARVLRTCVTAMAGTFDDVVKKVTRFKVQLADTTESDTVHTLLCFCHTHKLFTVMSGRLDSVLPVV